jgi:hypothetical protein
MLLSDRGDGLSHGNTNYSAGGTKLRLGKYVYVCDGGAEKQKYKIRTKFSIGDIWN